MGYIELRTLCDKPAGTTIIHYTTIIKSDHQAGTAEMASTCTQPLDRPSLDSSHYPQLPDHEIVTFTDLYSYDHRRAQADSCFQSMAWGNAQPMYSQYALPNPYPILNQYGYLCGMYPQPTLQETFINQPYQLPLYPWSASIQDGVAGSAHGIEFGIESRVDHVSSPTVLDMYGQIQDQAQDQARTQAQAQAQAQARTYAHAHVHAQARTLSESVGSSSSPQQLQLMPAGSTRTATPAGTGTAENLIDYVCGTLWRSQEISRQNLPTSSFEIKPGSVDVSVRFVVESSQNQLANQETSQEVEAHELAQQPLKEVLRILSSRASHIPGEHEICISSDATSIKIQTKHRGID